MFIPPRSNSNDKPANIFSVAGFLSCFAMMLIVSACTQSESTPTPELPATPTPTLAPTIPPTPTSTPLPTSTSVPTETLQPTLTPDADEIIWYNNIDNTATITVEGSTIIFEGDIGIQTYRDFLFTVRGKEDQITTIRINSGGGITDEGMKIGEWIFDHEIDVIVDEICFSTCANYIFTAGRNKIIEKDAIVGWHGSKQQDPFIAAGYGITVEELYGRDYDEMKEWGEIPPGESREEFIVHMMMTDDYVGIDEPEFLDKIGINLYLMVYGMLPDHFEYYMSEDTYFGGWTFSIEDMAKFGVHNVNYQGEGRYPSEKALEKFSVTVFDVTTNTVPPAVVPTPLPTPTPPPGSTPTPTPDPESDPWIEHPPATITLEGDTVIINGYIDFDAYSRFLNVIRGNEGEITTLKITSDDGFLEAATLIGLWVHDNEIDVIVDESCTYVCANYIFTAGNNKIIEQSAIVAWQGSPQWDEYDARSSGLTIEETMRRDIDNGSLGIDPSLDEKGREDFIREVAEYSREAIKQERRFLDATGINEDALVYGYIGIEWGAGYLPGHLFLGWTFSIEDMEKLGIENVTYNGSGTYPDRRMAQQREIEVFRVR